jgi:hypothetical protein
VGRSKKCRTTYLVIIDIQRRQPIAAAARRTQKSAAAICATALFTGDLRGADVAGAARIGSAARLSMLPIIEAVMASVTVGEISDVLPAEFGVHTDPAYLQASRPTRRPAAGALSGERTADWLVAGLGPDLLAAIGHADRAVLRVVIAEVDDLAVLRDLERRGKAAHDLLEALGGELAEGFLLEG